MVAPATCDAALRPSLRVQRHCVSQTCLLPLSVTPFHGVDLHLALSRSNERLYVFGAETF
jgi:hypothetical protein